MAGSRPDTWMPLYWGDYLRDTGHLSTAHHGAYLLMIGHYWSTGEPLPDDDSVLWRIVRADSMAQWKKLRPAVVALFTPQEGKLVHRRVEAELANASGKMEAATTKAKKAAQARWSGHHNDIPEASDTGCLEDATSNAVGMPVVSQRNQFDGKSSKDAQRVVKAKSRDAGAQVVENIKDSNATSINQALHKQCPSPSPSPSSEPKGSAGKPLDLSTVVFSDGLKWLQGATRRPEGTCRGLLGKWRKSLGDAELIAAIGRAQREGVIDPVPWFERVIQNHERDHAPKHGGFNL